MQIIPRLLAFVDTAIIKMNLLNSNKQEKTGTFPAGQLTGTIDPARFPVMPGINFVIATTLAAIPATDAGGNGQADITKGTNVQLANGELYRYTGTGSKTVAASYIFIADVTPDYSLIANKPTTVAAAGLTDAVTPEFEVGDLAARFTAGLNF